MNLTYQDLYNKGLSLIISICQNVPSYSVTVPANIRTGFSANTIRTSRSQGNTTRNNPNWHVGAFLTVTPQNALAVVPETTVTSQYLQFMTDQGIVGRFTERINSKGLINFCNVLAAFCSVRVKRVGAGFSLANNQNPAATTTRVPMYDSGTVSFPEVTNNFNQVDFASLDDLDSIQNALSTAAISLVRPRTITFNYAVTSCSSSSAFVAYFNLN